MTEYKTVEEALHDLLAINEAEEINVKDMETGETRQATVKDLQQCNFDICNQLADLLKMHNKQYSRGRKTRPYTFIENIVIKL